MKQGSPGTYGTESLPNITGKVCAGNDGATRGMFYNPDGCFTIDADTVSSLSSSVAAGTTTRKIRTSFNASLSSSTYQNNAKVNPDNAEIMYVIKF